MAVDPDNTETFRVYHARVCGDGQRDFEMHVAKFLQALRADPNVTKAFASAGIPRYAPTLATKDLKEVGSELQKHIRRLKQE